MQRPACLLALWFCSFTAAAVPDAVPGVPTAVVPDVIVPDAAGVELEEAAVTANEPRYAAPTTRDRIGRVWVPVHLDGIGPFRMVFDTGAMHSAVTMRTAQRLGIPLDARRRVLLQGATGSAIAPSIDIKALRVGDLQLAPDFLTVVPYAFGGADGLLGTDGMGEHRIAIDFRRDRIDIARSRNRRAAAGFSTVRFLPDGQNLLVVRATIAGKTVRAIIDTGAHSTVGNLALRTLLGRRIEHSENRRTEVHGATGAVQVGVGVRVPAIRLGELVVFDSTVTFADLHLFDNWQLGKEPALLIGMDILGLVDEIVIDYRRHELQIKPRSSGS
jgi:predicted aspartyl protease